tara:strand:+ start:6529 stop:7548 length:1020 start_codon:yes stop_codon:yes gene_type:complete
MNTTPGLVCSHHHLYSSLARGMPPPPHTPIDFADILEMIWWRLDQALDLDILYWSAKLGALEAIRQGTTAIIDHHESPTVIDGSLSVIAEACAEVGVRVNCSYGVTDRHGPEGAKRGLLENERFLKDGGKGMVGVHAAFTCSDETLESAAQLASDFQVGVHIHVAEGKVDAEAPARIRHLTDENWLIIHGVHLEEDHGLQGTIVHNPRSNMNNSVGYARPSRFQNRIALGTDGIGADMLEEFRVAYARHREDEVTATPDISWDWLTAGWDLFPEAIDDKVTWDYDQLDAWHLAYTSGVRPLEVEIGDEVVWKDGLSTRVDEDEVRAKSAEAAKKLHERL